MSVGAKASSLDRKAINIENVQETYVSIKHRVPNFGGVIFFEARDIKMEQFPEESFTFVIRILGTYTHSLSVHALRRSSEITIDSSSSDEEEGDEACYCDGRNYRFKLLFLNHSRSNSSDDYRYRVFGRFICKEGKDIFLFSHNFQKKYMVETLDATCLKNERYIDYTKVTELCIEIHRQKVNQVITNKATNSCNLHNNLFYVDPCNESVALKVSGKLFYVNKNILSSKSPVFEKMFPSRTRRNKSRMMIVDGFDADVVEIMLQFIYTEETKCIQKNPVDVYRAAHKYEVVGLMDKCIEWMKFNIDQNNFVSIAVLVSEYDMKDLQEKTEKYENKHFYTLVNQKEYREFLLQNLELSNIVRTLKLFNNKCPLSDDGLLERIFDFVKQNIDDIVEREDFLGMFKEHHEMMKNLFTFLFKKNGTKKRKISDLSGLL
ncbi:hypothetical protein QAD02_005624 [Eretmocerus hayati]|uniref:Uncharacterized protein n=1 Tax=Eretmocerus hayati TaxID=131215 RepID=A0ACC2NTA3_9HYME|nr:hypothetical protein QAD02_005624 [Eretmocerus hayati]